MSEHYYTGEPTSRAETRYFTLTFEGREYTFACDNGVFSKFELDEGSRILLESLPALYGRALDLGCGWGPVGVLLGKKYPQCEFVLCDVNRRAVELSQKNIELNGVVNARALISDGLTDVEGAFDFIITNPPIRAGKAVIYRLFDEALARLNAGGRLYIVIRRQQGAESALKYLEKADPRVIERRKGFWVIECGG